MGILMLVAVIGGFLGWLYEFVFYFFNSGMKEFYMQGGNLLPWINIYAIGAVLIVLAVAMALTGVLEFVAGWLVYTIGNGTRYWDYNVEIWNFGNIGGFVCLRSVLVFGVSALFLMYVVVPFCIRLSKKMTKRAFLTLAILLFAVVMVDEVTNLVLKNLGELTAMDFYRSLGMKYQEF